MNLEPKRACNKSSTFRDYRTRDPFGQLTIKTRSTCKRCAGDYERLAIHKKPLGNFTWTHRKVRNCVMKMSHVGDYHPYRELVLDWRPRPDEEAADTCSLPTSGPWRTLFRHQLEPQLA
ncbi:hypothetical protein MTO96_027027 [Rhipicephalus appendiculatus]